MELWLVLIIGVLAVAFALFLLRNVLKPDTGAPEMQNISNATRFERDKRGH